MPSDQEMLEMPHVKNDEIAEQKLDGSQVDSKEGESDRPHVYIRADMSQAPGKEKTSFNKIFGSMLSSISQISNPEPPMPIVHLDPGESGDIYCEVGYTN